jgi:hypothetical protein
MWRLVLGVLAVTLLLSLTVPAFGPDSSAQVATPVESSEVFETEAAVDPTPPAEPGTVPEGDVAEEGTPTDQVPETDLDNHTSNTEIQTPGYGNAAEQSHAAKRAEIRSVESACQSNPPPTSTMLGLPGSAGGDDHRTWGWLLIAVAAGLLLLAALGFALKRQRSNDSPIGVLSSAAAVVGIVSALAGLAVQFVPGVGVNERPPPEATMEVRQVHTRITRAEYAQKTGSHLHLTREDRREVGNVVWIEIQVRGYQDHRPSLQYALYDSQAAGALLPGTAKRVPLRPEGKDVETLFVPIWVGYPRSQSFEAQFRLLDGEQVQQMASTGKMAGSSYRYSCREPA